MVSKFVVAKEEYKPHEMDVQLKIHGSLDDVLKSRIEKCKRKEMFLFDGGEYLINTLDSKLVESYICEVEEDLRRGVENHFRLYIKIELSEESRRNAKKIS